MKHFFFALVASVSLIGSAYADPASQPAAKPAAQPAAKPAVPLAQRPQGKKDEDKLHLELGGGLAMSNAGAGATGSIEIWRGDRRDGTIELTAGAQITPQGKAQPIGHMSLTAPFEGSEWMYMGDPNFIQSDGTHNAFSLFPLSDIHIKGAHGSTDINYFRLVLMCDRTNSTCYSTFGAGVFTRQQINETWAIIASANAGYGVDAPMKSGDPSKNLANVFFTADLGVRYKAGQKTFVEPSLQVMDNIWWKTQGADTGVRSSDPVIGLNIKVVTPVL